MDGVRERFGREVAEAELLLREMCHRVANELALAIAAVHLVLNAKGPRARVRMLGEALWRLEASATLHRLLAGPIREKVDVRQELEIACRSILDARPAAARGRVMLDVQPAWVDGATARRISLVAVELLTNAVRHALDGRSGELVVTLRKVVDDLILSVVDDGPGLREGAATSGTGHGRAIVAELVERGGGTLSVDTGPRGTSVRVVMPIPEIASPEEDGIAF